MTHEEELTITESEDKRVVISLDSQVLNAIQQCNTYAKYKFADSIVPVGNNKLSLEIGLVIHEMLKYNYQHKFTQTLNARKEAALNIGEAYMLNKTSIASAKIFNEIKSVFLSYMDKYEMENFDILAVEEHYSKLMYEDDEVRIIYNGIIDLLVRRPDVGVVPYDHKTFGSWYAPHGMENQFQGYCWSIGGSTLVVNRIGVNRYAGKFERIALTFPKDVLEEWRINAVDCVIEHYNQMVNARYRKNYSSCGMYGGCDYRKLCSQSAMTRQSIISTEYKEIESWDPTKRDED